jgi:hypothetical protein
MKISNTAINTALGSVAIATGAFYKLLSPKLLELNTIADKCIKFNTPRNSLCDSNLSLCMLSLATNPLFFLAGIFERENIGRSKCPNELNELSKYENYSLIAFGALAISAGILAYRTAKAIINKINNTPSFWSQKRTERYIGNNQTRIDTTNYLFKFIPAGTNTKYQYSSSCTLL